jgi:hypothetical protein
MRARHGRPRAIRADHQPSAHLAQVTATFGAIAHDRGAGRVAHDAVIRAGAALCPCRLGAGAQPFVEHFAIDHADIADIAYRHVHRPARGRDHARRARPRHQQGLRHVELFEQARRHRAATGLDPPAAIEQQHGASRPRQIPRGGGSARTAADHHDITGSVPAHSFTAVRGVPASEGRRVRSASSAE